MSANHNRRKSAIGTAPNAFVEEQFDRLQAAIRCIGDLLAAKPARRAVAIASTLLDVVDPQAKRIAVNAQSKGEGWHVRLFRAVMPTVADTKENRAGFVRETMDLLRIPVFGSTDSYEQFGKADPERERRRKKINKRDSNIERDPAMFSLLLGIERAIRAGEQARDRSVRQAGAICRKDAREAAKRERGRAADLRRLKADIEEAARRARDRARNDRSDRSKRTIARIGAITAIAAIDARLVDLGQQRATDRKPEHEAAREALVGLHGSWSTTAARRRDRAERATREPIAAAAVARTRADALKTHREAIAGSWSGSANPGGAIGYLARLRSTNTEDPRVIATIQTALRRAHGAQVAASCAERSERREQDDGAATQGVDDQAEAGDDPRPLHERVRPVEHRVDARARWRERKLAEGTAEPMKYDAMPGVDEVGGATRRRADELNESAVKRMFSIADTAMTDSSWWRNMKHDGEIRAARTVAGEGAAMIFAPDGVDLSSPRRTAEDFMRTLPTPKVCLPRMVDGVMKRGRLDRRIAHIVVSLPKTDIPEGMVGDQALLGAAFGRLRLMGLDPRRHKCLVFRHDDHKAAEDKGCLHIHVMADRVRDDGKVWDIGGMDRTAAANAASNLMGALFLKKQRSPKFLQPMFGAPVAREGKDGEGRGARIKAMEALEKLARGHMRCDLKWQDADQPDGRIGYLSPMHGHDADGTKSPERVVLGKNAIRDALVLCGHSGILPGFTKIDDVGRDSMADALEHETTTRDPNTSTPWRFLDAEERAVKMWEHLFRKLAERCG